MESGRTTLKIGPYEYFKNCLYFRKGVLEHRNEHKLHNTILGF